ncbi:DUF4892 domain-containing protein [Exilibacterium tricleocarpae]|uniref:DUF4892 domain-containing protein n=1 Tax=Exilibacterium tricleocarpae TaxID=2591008 RepID=A0A545SRS8_9GAMM|nr:DUF4892 domain-containing protein [Exilibacterium tricleocarpae]TQV67678.1 DUF4892 domain-containing protein [Exilibacterium tricleocarpae]
MTSKNLFRLCVAVMLAGCLSAGVQAATTLSLTGFPNARTVFDTDTGTDDYRLALGAMEKVNNIWRPEQEQRVGGQLHRETVEAPSGFSADEVYQHFLTQLEAMDARELFSCQGRRCGSSNSWANNHFGIKQLYGLDQHQYYGAFEIVGADRQLYFVALYTVRRGNKRIYGHVEVLHSRTGIEGLIAARPEVIGQQLLQRGFYVLPGFRVGQGGLQQEEQHLQALTAALRKQRLLRVAVVGHDYGDGGEQSRQETALGYARYVRELLIQGGIDEARLEIYGLGSLAPDRRAARNLRVEIVRLDG